MMTTLRFQSFPLLAAATLAGAATACSDNPTAVRGTPGIQVLSTYQPDTIEAILTSPFVAIVRDSTGLPLAGALVTIFGAQGPFADAEMTVARVNATLTSEYAGALQETTDANGKVSVRLRLGTVVPRGRLVIAVPVAGYRDTVSFAVLPGNPAGVRAAPKDTTVYIDRTAQLRGTTVDRHGNARPEPVTYESGPTVAVTATGVLQPSAYARESWRVRGAYGVDTAWVSVVPHGRVLGAMYFDGGGPFVMSELDGSSYRRVPTLVATFDAAPAWAPDGKHFIYSTFSLVNINPAQLYLADSTGASTQLLPSGGFQYAGYARWSRDGAWIYFSAQEQGKSTWSLWRVAATGGAPERLTTNLPSGFTTWRPDPSPDGTRVAFIDNEAGWTTRTLDLGTATVSSWIATGLTVRWSPDGSRLATMPDYGGGPMMLVDPATGATSPILANDGSLGVQLYSQAFDWSPDGKWLVLNRNDRLELLQVDTGLLLPLAWSGIIGQPAWLP